MGDDRCLASQPILTCVELSGRKDESGLRQNLSRSEVGKNPQQFTSQYQCIPITLILIFL